MDDRKVIIDEIAGEYFLIPTYIFRDDRLNSFDICLISALYSFTGPGQKKVCLRKERVLKAAKITENIYYSSLKRLQGFGWIEKIREVNEDGKIRVEYYLGKPERSVYNEPGSSIARAWSKYFGTRLIRYEELQDLKDFVLNQGMEEELVLKVMEYSSKNARGDPFSYTRATLINLSREGILTVEEFEKGDFRDGEQFQKNNRGKEKRVRKERPREELKADGYE